MSLWICKHCHSPQGFSQDMKCFACHGPLEITEVIATTATLDNRAIMLEELKRLCQKFDKDSGQYPEDEYEGLSVYSFICNELDIPLPFMTDEEKEAWAK